ncbi:MAG: amidohydrolase family protein [Lysobacterales bacterium]
MRTATLLALSLLTLAPQSEALTLACGRVFDSASGKLLGPHTVTVSDGRITAVTPGAPAAGVDAVDHSQQVCLPGLIDLHTHISNFESSPQSYSEVFRLNPGDYALRAALNARKTLRAGFTTIRDLGDTGGASLALRNAINQGIAEGPRIYTAGKSIATTGGHADPTNGRSQALQGKPGPSDGVINGPEEAAAAVRYRYKEGADLIKITATGGVLSYAKNGLNPQFTQEEANAIVAAAKDYGFAVAAHAHGKEGIRRAILAGVTSIEHGSFLDEDLFPLMKEHHTWYVPTLLAGWWTASKANEPGYYPPIVAAKAKAISPVMQSTFNKAYKAGVKIAFGTDTGVSPHGMNAKEFKLMVDAGMPPAEAIQAATRNAAEVLGMSAEIGAIAPGHYADIVVVAGDPIADITQLEHPLMTYKDGVAYAPLAAAGP